MYFLKIFLLSSILASSLLSYDSYYNYDDDDNYQKKPLIFNAKKEIEIKKPMDVINLKNNKIKKEIEILDKELKNEITDTLPIISLSESISEINYNDEKSPDLNISEESVSKNQLKSFSDNKIENNSSEESVSISDKVTINNVDNNSSKKPKVETNKEVIKPIIKVDTIKVSKKPKLNVNSELNSSKEVKELFFTTKNRDNRIVEKDNGSKLIIIKSDIPLSDDEIEKKIKNKKKAITPIKDELKVLDAAYNIKNKKEVKKISDNSETDYSLFNNNKVENTYYNKRNGILNYTHIKISPYTFLVIDNADSNFGINTEYSYLINNNISVGLFYDYLRVENSINNIDFKQNKNNIGLTGLYHFSPYEVLDPYIKLSLYNSSYNYIYDNKSINNSAIGFYSSLGFEYDFSNQFINNSSLTFNLLDEEYYINLSSEVNYIYNNGIYLGLGFNYDMINSEFKNFMNVGYLF